MVRKKIDQRIRTLIENCVKTNHRSFIVLVGDHGREQVVNLHFMLSKAAVKARPSVLWCYKKDLGFSSNKQKRMRQMKKKLQRGIANVNEEDPFELFVSSTNIRYTYYADSHKILGTTFGMCVLQDFEALTPNLLARTIETVEGGGMVVLLLRSVSSLKQLYTMSMDVHARYRTESHQDVVGRFNERFILSLGSCANCLVVNDQLDVLPLSSHALNISPIPAKSSLEALSPDQIELAELKESLADTQPVGALIKTAKTLDQAKAILTFVEGISEKSLRSTVTLTAGRGRGKSAALGVAIASAVAYGYSNIFVTSPSPENLKTLFEFVFKGFDSLDYQEHLDYDLVQSTNPAFNKAVVRVNIYRQHRQTIQYIQPQDGHKLSHAELVVIDEAAAIPLPLVKNLLGPYLVFMSSTINGYEGTGRSLSLKLIASLRKAASPGGDSIAAQRTANSNANGAVKNGARVLREIVLSEPIRYTTGDPIEAWLNELLCLDVSATSTSAIAASCPHPGECELYHIERDTLFSYHKASEAFLQRVMSLYVASHYKNTPNDLQLMADAPAHRLFCLLGPVDSSKNELPEVLCVIQVAFEGEISRRSVARALGRGNRASGDLIPWTIAQQYQDPDFASLSGARIVRIATHPDYTGMGYGARSLSLLRRYYEGSLTGVNEGSNPAAADNMRQRQRMAEASGVESGSSTLTDEVLAPRTQGLPPLLVKLDERPPERIHYLGVSYGLTPRLYTFWKKRGNFVPVYLRQSANELTGEHTCIMLRPLDNSAFLSASLEVTNIARAGWINTYWTDFRQRFVSLLSFDFKTFEAVTALSVLTSTPQVAAAGGSSEDRNTKVLSKRRLYDIITPFDLKRLDAYSKNLVDYHIILDLLPLLARLWCLRTLPDIQLSPVQACLLVGVGLQHRSIDQLVGELDLPATQLLALFGKLVRKFSTRLHSIAEKAIEKSIGESLDVEMADEKMDPLPMELEDELDVEGKSAIKDLQNKQSSMLHGLDNIDMYAVDGNDSDWEAALHGAEKTTPGTVSVRARDGVSKKKITKPSDKLESATKSGNGAGKKKDKKNRRSFK